MYTPINSSDSHKFATSASVEETKKKNCIYGQTSNFELFNDRHNPGAPWPSPPPKPLAALRLLGDGAWASAHNYLASAQSRCE
jgi:hypothetical protein